jgi:hypothetical protein
MFALHALPKRPPLLLRCRSWRMAISAYEAVAPLSQIGQGIPDPPRGPRGQAGQAHLPDPEGPPDSTGQPHRLHDVEQRISEALGTDTYQDMRPLPRDNALGPIPARHTLDPVGPSSCNRCRSSGGGSTKYGGVRALASGFRLGLARRRRSNEKAPLTWKNRTCLGTCQPRVEGTFSVKNSARTARVMVSADGRGLVSQAGAVLLWETMRVTGLGRGLQVARAVRVG